MGWIDPQEYLKALPQAVHGCGVLLLDEADQVLMLHEAPDPDKLAAGWPARWLWPGGHLDHDDQTPVDAALREVAEETGLELNASQLRLLGAQFTPATTAWPAVTDYQFLGPVLTKEQVAALRLSPEHDELRFAPADGWRGVAQDRTVDLLERLLHFRNSSGQGIHIADRRSAREATPLRTDFPIAEVVGRYTTLTPSGGAQVKGACPLHGETRGQSLYVNPAKGVFSCFECRASGDAVGFVMAKENLSFDQAIALLRRTL